MPMYGKHDCQDGYRISSIKPPGSLLILSRQMGGGAY